MRATIRLTVAPLILLSYSAASMASEPVAIPALGGLGVLGIAALIAVVGLFSINKRK